jgi:hypothetical protein
MRFRHPTLGRFSTLALLTSAFLSLCIGATAQTLRHQPKPIGTVTGQVFSAAGYAIPGARVMLQDADGKNPRTTVTDSQGRFTFPKLPIGIYDLSASSKDLSSEWRHDVVVHTGKQATLNLHLATSNAKTVKLSANRASS